jgi:hypothetical protein
VEGGARELVEHGALVLLALHRMRMRLGGVVDDAVVRLERPRVAHRLAERRDVGRRFSRL